MGQNLSNGVYLPDEGERNCYSGLAANWNILNTAVGNIAGKASSSHTHGNISNDGKVGTTANLPLITGTGGAITAGAFGNQANTFCEGNDSRLSDARTPLSHTHTKSDVTDLFNSANTWSDTNTYSVTGDVPIKITNGKDATNPSATEMKDIRFSDVNGKIIGGVRHSLESGGTSKMHLYSRSFSSDGSSNSNHGLLIVNNKQTGVHEVQSESNFIPSANNSYDLGSSSYQWKTLNGINPGALSLPDYNNYLDITSSIPVASLDGNTSIQLNDYLADKTGWLSIVIDDTAGNFIIATQGKAGGATVFNNSRTFHTGAQSNGFISVFFPIIAGLSKPVLIKALSLIQMRFYRCLGNV